MPSGATLLLYSADYVSTPRQYIPNTVSAGAAPKNLLSLSRRNFANGHGSINWALVGGTVTDAAATAPDGSNDASTLVAAGDWYLTPGGFGESAGTYTVACNVKRNTGTDQQFKIGDFNSTLSTTQTATSAWQRFSFTYTTAGGSYPVLISFDRATGANIQVCDFEIFAGSSDLGPEVPSGHLVLGSTAYNAPSCSGGELDATAGYGSIKLASGTSLTAFTAFCTVKKISTGADNFHAFLSKVQSYGSLTFYVDNGPNYTSSMGGPQAALGGAALSGLNPGLWQLYGAYSVIAYRFDGALLSLWIDGVKLYEVATTGSAVAIADFFVGIIESPSYTSGAKINAIALYPTSLSDAAMSAANAALRSKAAQSSLTMRNGAMLIACGDSITAGYGVNQGYPDLYSPNTTQTQLFGVNLGASGTGLTYLEGLATALDARLSSRVGKKNILTAMVGANDLVSLDATGLTSWLNRYATFCSARRTAGWTVSVGTVLPRSDLAASFNTNRATANTTIRTWVGTNVDAVFDVAANATMGPDAAASDTTYYADGVHPTATGQGILETVYRTTVNAL